MSAQCSLKGSRPIADAWQPVLYQFVLSVPMAAVRKSPILPTLQMRLPHIQEAERKERRRQAREQEQAELRRVHSQWSKKQQEGLREQLPVQPPRPVALKREDASILVNLRRDVTGDAAIVRPAIKLLASQHDAEAMALLLASGKRGSACALRPAGRQDGCTRMEVR